MDITFRHLPTTPTEIDRLMDVAEQAEAMAKFYAIRTRVIRSYARQYPDRAVLVAVHLKDAVDSMGLWACLAGINFEALRRASLLPIHTPDS